MSYLTLLTTRKVSLSLFCSFPTAVLTNKPLVKRRLALGLHYSQLNMSEEQERRVREDLILAKKYENSILDRATKKIENEELQKMIQSSLRSEDEDREKLKLYYDQLHAIQVRAEEKMRREIQRAEEYENKKLNNSQEMLIRSETQKLLNGRFLFQEAEKAREEMERKEFEERRGWKSNYLFSDKR